MNASKLDGTATAPVVAVLGAGIVGARITRELVSGREAPSVAVHTSRPDRAVALRAAFGGEVSVVHDAVAPSAVRNLTGEGSLKVVVLSGASEDQAALARSHLHQGRSVVCTTDEPFVVEQLLLLDSEAVSRGLSVVVGAAFSPGLSCLLASRAVARLDSVDEIHVARHGAGGPLCAARRLHAMRGSMRQWRDRRWTTVRTGSGRELCWFPDPLQAKDCYLVDTAEPLVLLDAFASLQRVDVRMAMSRRDRLARLVPALLPAPPEGGVGGVRVEVRGHRGGSRRDLVYGALDRPGVVAAALVAEVTLALLAGRAPTGAHGLAAWPDPDALLSALRIRGVRVAVFGSD